MRLRNKNIVIAIAGISLVLLFKAGYMLVVSDSQPSANQTTADLNNNKELKNTIAGLKTGDIAEIILMTKSGRKHAVRLDQKEGADKLSFSLPEDIHLAQEPGYTITYHLSDRENHFTDISLSVDHTRSEALAYYKALPLDSTVGLKIDAFLAHSDVPVDWAGHITLSSEVEAQNQNQICLTLENSKSDMVICHDKPGVAL